MRVVVVPILAVCVLISATLSIASAAPATSATQSGGTAGISEFPRAAADDSSALTGSGINGRSWPIDRPVPGGAMRKDPGSSTWYFVRGLSDAELREAYKAYLADMVAKHGDELRDVMIEVKDSADVALLRGLGMAPPDQVPATLSTRLLYRQLPDLRKSGLFYWDKNGPRPVRNSELREKLPAKTAEAVRGIEPNGRFTPAPSPTMVNGALSTEAVTIWAEGFETNSVPGTYWAAGDLNSTSGSDYWGDILTSCGAWVHGGSWSVGCNGYGSYPSCTQYVNDEDAYMQNSSYLNMSGYSTYDASFYVKYQTEAGYDYFWWAYSIGGGWIQVGDTYSGSGGWTQLGVTISNASHTADNFAIQFNFYSDYTVTDVGAYVDDVLLRGNPLQPNLTYYTPSGWSGPIVPASVTGTTTTGTLYAGQPTYIDWAIQNNGVAAAGPFYVYYYFDGNLIGSDYVSGLTNGYFWTRTDWSYTVASSGTHTLSMTIDATNTVAESNESDNTYSASFYWNPAQPPDLIVQSIVPTSTTPTIGSTINATLTIKNQGPGYANGSFSTYFYNNLGSMPTQGQLPYDDSHTTFSLAPGATDTYTIYGLSSSYAVPWNMYAFADAANTITNESSETNNAYGPSTVNWSAGTVTVSGTLAYDDTSYTSAPRVNNRPVRFVKVELWDSDAGQGSPDELLATTITDASGQFVFQAISNHDEADQGRLDLYVKAYVRSQEARLGTAVVEVVDASMTPWTFQSGTYQDIGNGAVNLGTIKPLDYGRRAALNIYEAILCGYEWAIARGGTPRHPWYVKVQWQQELFTDTYYSYPDTTIRIAGAPSTAQGDLRPNEWDNNAIYHEYGHHVAYLFGFDDPSVGGDHTPQTEATCDSAPCARLAWAEGCGHFLATMIELPTSSVRRNTETNAGWTSTHVFEMDLETGILTYDALCCGVVNDQGWTWEVPVAGTLWDIYDIFIDNQNMDACFESLGQEVCKRHQAAAL